MFRKTSVNSEEFIFYLDLTSEFLRKKSLIKDIGNFIKEKEKFNSSTTYGVVIFQEEDNPVTSYNEENATQIINVIDDKWDSKESRQSFFENGLFEVLSYIFRKSREARKNYRVIVISDTPSTLSEEYHNALYDLLIKARNFNTFIDIIRVGDSQFYDDDVKLKVITSETHGGVFYCKEPRLFSNILGSLIQNKAEFTVVQPDEDNLILREDKIFYEKLAVDLISLDADEEEICSICEREICPICNTFSDEVHKCYNCNAKYHSCCAAEYAIANPVGFRHLFRCIQCDTLLKLDEDLVEMIFTEDDEEYEEEVIEAPENSELEALEEIELGDEESEAEEEVLESVDEILTENNVVEVPIIEREDEFQLNEIKLDLPELKKPPSLKNKPPKIKPPPPPTPLDEEEKKVRVGGFFGQEVVVKTNNNKTKEPSAIDTVIVENGDTIVKEKISITKLKPPRKRTIKLCTICGATLSNVSICPTCGSRVD